MFLDRNRVREIASLIRAASGENNVPGRLVAGVGTHVGEADDATLYAWFTDAEAVERWEVLIVANRLLTHLEAQNTNPDWNQRFDTGSGAYVRSRTLNFREVRALEMRSISHFEQFSGLEWQASEWRIVLRDGIVIEPAVPRGHGAGKHLTALVTEIAHNMASRTEL